MEKLTRTKIVKQINMESKKVPKEGEKKIKKREEILKAVQTRGEIKLVRE